MLTTIQPFSSRKVLLYQDEDGFFIAEVSGLPGCVSQGKTRDEALKNVREAISLHVEVLLDRSQHVSENDT